MKICKNAAISLIMKKILVQLLVITCFFVAGTGLAMAQGRQPLRLFLIGNSFSQNAALYLPALSKDGGHQLIIGRAEIGGCPLQRHWDSVAVNLVDSNRGKAYNGKSLKQLLSQGTWDVVSIQQASILSGDVKTYQPYAKKLYDFIKQLQPGAKVVFHQTWPYRADAKKFGNINGNVVARNQQEMWAYSRAAYHATAGSMGIQLIPVGDAFWKVASDAKWGFRHDSSYDYKNPVYPQLPSQQYSLNAGYHWDKDKNLAFDPNHANTAGCYLAGLVWYGFLFNEDPLGVHFTIPDLTPEFAAELKQVAAEVLRNLRK